MGSVNRFVSSIEVYLGDRRLGSHRVAQPDGERHTLFVGRYKGHGCCLGPENGWCNWWYIPGLDIYFSRDQLKIVTSGKRYQSIIPTGTNRTFLDGYPLENGREYFIHPGQIITVDGSQVVLILG